MSRKLIIADKYIRLDDDVAQALRDDRMVEGKGWINGEDVDSRRVWLVGYTPSVRYPYNVIESDDVGGFRRASVMHFSPTLAERTIETCEDAKEWAKNNPDVFVRFISLGGYSPSNPSTHFVFGRPIDDYEAYVNGEWTKLTDIKL